MGFSISFVETVTYPPLRVEEQTVLLFWQCVICCCSTDMYRQFQHDLYRLRLEAARGFAGVLQKGLSPVSVNSAEPVKLHVEVSYMLLTVRGRCSAETHEMYQQVNEHEINKRTAKRLKFNKHTDLQARSWVVFAYCGDMIVQLIDVNASRQNGLIIQLCPCIF